jgi:hypothetical protein
VPQSAQVRIRPRRMADIVAGAGLLGQLARHQARRVPVTQPVDVRPGPGRGDPGNAEHHTAQPACSSKGISSTGDGAMRLFARTKGRDATAAEAGTAPAG